MSVRIHSEKFHGATENFSSTPPVWQWNLKPGFGFCSIFFSTILAITLIPKDVQEPGNLRLAATVMALGMMAPFIRALFVSPKSLFHPVPILAASPVYWILMDPIQAAYPLDSIGQDDIILTFLAIGLFSTGVWLGCIGKAWKLPRIFLATAGVPLSTRALFKIGVLAFGLAFLRFAIPANFDISLMLSTFSANRWNTPWARGSIGGWDAFLDHIGYFGYILPPLAGLLIRNAGLRHWRTVTIAAFAIVIIALYSTDGGRRIIGVMVGSGVVAWFLGAKKPRSRDLLVLAIFGVALLCFMQLMLQYRNVGISAAFAGDSSALEPPTEFHVDDNFLRLTQVIQIIPAEHDHVGLKWVLWVLDRPIPRVLWPGKPIGMGFDLPAYLGAKGVSYSISLIGELYVAYGFLGCFVGGIVLGAIARSVAQIFNDGPKPGVIVFFSCALFAFFAGMRSGIELVLMSYGVLAWVGLTWLFRRLRR
jgi:hypothetical protein